MNTSASKAKSNRKGGRAIKVRLMRRVVPLILISVVIISALESWSLLRNARQDFGYLQDIALTEVRDHLVGGLQPVVTSARQLTNSSSFQTFALETVSISSSQALLQQSQAGVIAQMQALLDTRALNVRSLRYIMRTGSVWTEVSRADSDNVLINTEFQLRRGDPAVETALNAGLAAEAGTVVISGLDIIVNDDSSITPVMSFVAPITRPNDINSILGVLQIQVDATNTLRSVIGANQDPVAGREGRRFILVNNANQLLADSSTISTNYLRRLNEEGGNFEVEDDRLLSFLQENSGTLDIIAFRARNQLFTPALVSSLDITEGSAPDMPWRLVVIDDSGQAFITATRFTVLAWVFNTLIAAIILYFINRWLDRNLRPIGVTNSVLQHITQDAARLQQSSQAMSGRATTAESAAPTGAPPIPTLAYADDAHPDDEDRVLYETARQISQQLESLNAQIEAQTERYSRNIKIAARISRETAQLEDIDELLNRAINLICNAFGLYHAQVFLIDDANINAVLVYSRGDVGRRLLDKQHKLPVGSNSVIGRVTATGQPVIVNDTALGQQKGTHAFNPLLPDTRAEMALPLQIGDIILGALDLQSDKPNVFFDEELQTYQLLADQLAIAVYKTRLLRQSEQRVRQIETLNRQLTQMAWEELERKVGLEQTYRYNLMRVEQGDIEDTGVNVTTSLISVPIKIRDEVIGTINAAPPEEGQFTTNDRSILEAVAARVALAVENARLFEETQQNLEETSRLYETNRSLNEAEGFDDIIAAIVNSAMQGAIGGQIGIFADDTADEPNTLEIIAGWFAPTYKRTGLRADAFNGLMLDMSSNPLLHDTTYGKVVLINDVSRDARLSGALQDLFKRIQNGAAVLIPLGARGGWRGVLLVEYPDPREFNDLEGRVFNSLSDQAGVAIDNRLLLQQTENALSQNERLYAASRIINQAQGLDDLVRAAVATSDSSDLNFGLAIFEGALDETGWSTRLLHVAQSRNSGIYEPNRSYSLEVSADSPLRNREPHIVGEDLPLNDETSQTLLTIVRKNGDRYGVIYPLFSVNLPTALFFISRKSADPLHAEDHEIYRALTGQMSTVIQNKRLLEQTASALDETRRLYDASRAITNAQDVERMYEAAVLHISFPNTRTTRVNVFIASPERVKDATHLDLVYAWSRNADLFPPSVVGVRTDNQSLPLPSLIGNDTVAYYDDIPRNMASSNALSEYFAASRANSVIVAAMISRQSWQGLLTIESSDRRAFDEQYVRYVQAIADQIAIALENQMLFEEAQQEARQALALAEASQLANQVGGEFTESINTLFARVAETAGYDRWLLMLLNEAQTELELITQFSPANLPRLVNGNLLLSTDEHSIADAVRFNRTLIVNVPQEYPAFRKPELATLVGKHIATPIITGENIIGALIIGRGVESQDMTERDETLVSTLAAQVAVTVENRRLFLSAESERRTLSSILNTLPAGVLVLDARTLKPVQYNAQIVDFLGSKIDENLSFSAKTYNLYRTGTKMHYPNDALPIFMTLSTGAPAFSDDVSVINDDGRQIDLLINAAPIRNSDGEIINIVAAFEDISNLRSLENTLQDNLRETISLYEATSALTEADELNDVFDTILFQLIMMEPDNAYLILMDEEGLTRQVIRSMNEPLEGETLPDDILQPDRAMLIDDVSQGAPLTTRGRDALIQQGIYAIGSIPLRARRRSMPLGWIVVTYALPHTFTTEQERFLSTLGDNAAVAIDNRYLFSSTQSALRETMSLYAATTAISRVRALEDLAQVVRSSLESLSPDFYAAYIMTDPSRPDYLTEMFNISLEGNKVDFRQLLLRYGLFRDESIFVENLYTIAEPTPLQNAIKDMGDIHAFASVSLRVKGMPDGRVFVAYREPHRFSEGDSRYLNAIADSASVVVDNIILLEQIQTALDETSTLYQASRALADAVTPQDILDVVVSKLIDPHINQAFLALLNTPSWSSPNAKVQVVSSWQRDDSIDLQGIALTAEQFPAWSLLSSSSVVIIDDIYHSDLDELERMGIESLDTRSLVVIPLRVPARAIGAIWIGSNEGHNHSDGEQRVYQAFAEQASLSLEASFLLEQTERRARQLATSAEVSQIASSILDLNVLLPQVVNLIKEAFGYDHAQVFLMDDENRYAVLHASTGEAGNQLLAIGHKLERGSKSVIGQVTEQGRPVIALDTSDARVIHRPNPYLPLTRSEMALPIVIKEQVIGALDVQSNSPNAFTEDDIAVLTALAAQVSVAIDNARLFNQAQSRADDMSFLFTITTAAASADTLEESLQNVVELLRGSMGALSVGIYLITDGEHALEHDDPRAHMRIIALAGSEQPLSEVEEVYVGDDHNLIGVVAQDLIPYIVEDINEEPRYLPVVSSARSAVIVPQNTGGELIGVIVAESERAHAYNQDTLTLLLTLSGTLAAIVQNARLLEQLRQSNDELKTLDRLKSDFLANMSHELRTPLNSIIGFSRVMLKGIDGPLTDMQEQDLTTIYNSGQHLLGLINDILDHAKIAADKMDLQKDYFDVQNLINGVRSIGIGLVKEKPVEINVEIAPNLPKGFGDEFRTRQVLLNLVSNASKFTNEGSITISVYLVKSDQRDQRMIRIDVADTGIGIDKKDLPLLFEAFRQVDSSLTRMVGGTGLGLPIAKSLVELQGGEMTVESALGTGSTFSITIPTAPIDDESESDEGDDDNTPDTAPMPESAAPTAPPPQPKRSGPPPGVFQQKREILLIEDNPERVDQFRKLLQREGFSVMVASTQLEAIPMAGTLRPTLIIMDVEYAGGKGWETIEILKDRDDTFDIPVIVVSMTGDSERVYQLGAYRFIPRPYTPDELMEAVLAAEKDSNIERILIIDDQPESTRLLEEILLEHGKYRIFAAHNGADGISLVARRRPSLIILDLRMPGMDGFAVLDELRARPETANIPVMVVTGETTLSEGERDKLSDLQIIYKTDLNQENYQHFIEEVRRKITDYHGD